MTTQTAAPPKPCDPATLLGVCAGDCGRQLHRGHSGGGRHPCAAGHPVNGGHGMCPSCVSKHRRRDAPVVERPTRRPVEIPTYTSTDDGQWKVRAACREADPEAFFPEVRGRGDIRRLVWPAARDHCQPCPVADACHDLAERTGAQGLWAGAWRRAAGNHLPLTAGARARMRRKP